MTSIIIAGGPIQPLIIAHTAVLVLLSVLSVILSIDTVYSACCDSGVLSRSRQARAHLHKCPCMRRVPEQTPRALP